MHHTGRALALLALLAAGGCVKLDSFACAQSSECQYGGVLGTCEFGGVCSFPDPACPSGKKYGELAGEQSGQCVGMTSDTTGGPTTAPTGPGPDTTDPSATTFDPDTTTFDPTMMTSEVSATTSTTSTTDPTQASDPGSTTGPGPTCGQIGEACVDGACCGGCAVCDPDNTCTPAPAEQNPCGTCSFCDGDGECALASPDTPCPVDCSDIVWKEVVKPPLTACYAYGAMPTMGTCDDEGGCTLPDPVVAKCPQPALDDDAAKLGECEILCQEPVNPCVPGGPASAVDMDSYCSLVKPTPKCTTTCSDDKAFVNPAICVQGVCTYSDAIECGPYVCDPDELMCLTACMADEDCTLPATCIDGKCT